MSLSSADLLDLLNQWEELKDLNLSDPNVTRVDATVCSGTVGHASLLYVLSIFYLFIFLVGIASNALVVWVNLRSNRKCSDVFVLQLAAADLVAVATLPVQVGSMLIGRWPFGAVLCKLTHLVFSVNLFSSILFLTCMSVERYLSVTLRPGGRRELTPLRRMPTRRLVCAAVWMLALAAAAPETYFLQTVVSPHHSGSVCRPVFSSREMMVFVQMIFSILGFLLPLPIIIASYLALPPDPDRGVSRRVVLSYIVVFVLCWLPLHVVLVLDLVALLLPFSCSLEGFLWVALQVTQCVSMMHCVLNPVLYSFLHRSYRYDLMKAFIFRYSSRSGVARLIDNENTENTSETFETLETLETESSLAEIRDWI
ncbi:atypical chemokine receptor 3-like [Trematomus bernacchii]|uniref:atypical chemokine receptor 3-like n=1 Tax=Trematomus bernacchii TaxID=40690 RepID=UPI00146DF0EB|nr:atypical chemokine receptor 3-like [Trematomus bernacchii]